ncbi:hypothetical protein ABZY81_31640 [Streptomyces sp. NPDC006514]|uniref:RICIN domain-containing protein n=1 Tax=Streptomyces sp. NPDC006514 TaxID=3154308 RepID=UPI0033AAE834
MSDSASASTTGSVTWTNVATGRCLSYDNLVSGPDSSVYTTDCLPRGGQFSVSWKDAQASDGSWTQKTMDNRCLTSFGNSVYLENCAGNADDTNWYERWYELSTTTGWKLKNRMTGMILDSNAAGDVYAISSNGTNYQRWK